MSDGSRGFLEKPSSHSYLLPKREREEVGGGQVTPQEGGEGEQLQSDLTDLPVGRPDLRAEEGVLVGRDLGGAQRGCKGRNQCILKNKIRIKKRLKKREHVPNDTDSIR